MNILFNDLIQYSNAPEAIRNPSLTYFMLNEPNEPGTHTYLDGGTASSLFDGNFDGGGAAAIFDETWDGGDALNTKEFEISLHEPSAVNCFGAGNTDSTLIGIYLVDTVNNEYYERKDFTGNGLYMLNKTYENIKQIRIVFSGTYIGRTGTGYAVNVRTSIPKEPTLVSTNSPRVTLSGQVIAGLGGYNYWRVSLDTRYKIDMDKLEEIKK